MTHWIPTDSCASRHHFIDPIPMYLGLMAEMMHDEYPKHTFRIPQLETLPTSPPDTTKSLLRREIYSLTPQTRLNHTSTPACCWRHLQVKRGSRTQQDAEVLPVWSLTSMPLNPRCGAQKKKKIMLSVTKARVVLHGAGDTSLLGCP